MASQANRFDDPRPGAPRPAPAQVFDFVAATLRRGRMIRIEATDGAMVPSVREGEWVTVQPAGAAEVHVGDVVLLSRGAVRYLRRVIEVEGGDNAPTGLIVRGDAADMVEPAELWRLLGRAVTVERHGKQVELHADPRKLGVRVRLGAHRIGAWLLGD